LIGKFQEETGLKRKVQERSELIGKFQEGTEKGENWTEMEGS
jgi:hypothetical protein